MGSAVFDEVTEVDVPITPTLVVAATTAWSQFPALWPGLSGEVWACLRADGINGGCRNIMVYRDVGPDVAVEIGVLAPAADVTLAGRVSRSALPVGRAARTVHRGPYSELGIAHDAVHAWCAAHHRSVTRTRWEVYGPHSEDPAEVWVEIDWLLASPPD